VGTAVPSNPSLITTRPPDGETPTHRNVKELAADINTWVDNWNQNPTPFVWHKSAEQILERLAGYCQAINAQPAE
jgi:hypothetical protein